MHLCWWRRDCRNEICREYYSYICKTTWLVWICAWILDIKQDLASDNVKRRWPSTINRIKKMYSFRLVVHSTINCKEVELADLFIPERSWGKAYNVFTFLKSTARVTEAQYGFNCITLSRTTTLLQLIEKNGKNVIQDNNTPFMQNTSSILKKL